MLDGEKCIWWRGNAKIANKVPKNCIQNTDNNSMIIFAIFGHFDEEGLIFWHQSLFFPSKWEFSSALFCADPYLLAKINAMQACKIKVPKNTCFSEKSYHYLWKKWAILSTLKIQGVCWRLYFFNPYLQATILVQW